MALCHEREESFRRPVPNHAFIDVLELHHFWRMAKFLDVHTHGIIDNIEDIFCAYPVPI